MNFGRLLKVAGGRPKRLPLLFECLICFSKFSTEDVEKKKFYVETRICRACYMDGLSRSPHIWCFGKLQTRSSPGFSEKNVSCRLLCPDRKICKRYANKYKQGE